MILKNGKRIDGCSDTLPIGTVQPFLGLTPPKGYLVCQGQAVNKITYSELYKICGDTFGQSTETEFYLPDLRGKTIAGYNENDIAMNTIGKLLGETTHKHSTGNHTLTIAEIPAHKHNFQSIAGSSGGDLGDYTMEYLLEEGSAYPGRAGVATSGDWGSYGTLWITETGGSQAHNHGDTGETPNYQPTIVMNWIVKAVMTVPIQSSLVTAYTDSSTDVYSCDYVNEAIRVGLGDNVPAGSIVDFNGEEIPEGWEIAPEYASAYIGTSQPTEEQDLWIETSKNLFNKKAVSVGYLTENGMLFNDSDAYKTSDFIKIKPNTTYHKTQTDTVRLKFYNSNRQRLTNNYSDVDNASEDISFVSPNNAYYMRVSLANQYLDTLQIEEGDKATTYTAYQLNNMRLKDTLEQYNIFVPNSVHIGSEAPVNGENIWIKKATNMLDMGALNPGYIALDGGVSGQTGDEEMRTDYIAVKPNTVYTFKIVETIGTKSPWLSIAEYNINKTFLGRPTERDVYPQSITITTSPDTHYVILNARNLNTASDAFFTEGGSLLDLVYVNQGGQYILISDIIEEGENGHGSWVKYRDGRMECRAAVRLSAADSVFSQAYGSVFYNGRYTGWAYPVPFKTAPVVIGTAYFQGGLGGYGLASSPTETYVDGYLYYTQEYDFSAGGTLSGRVGVDFVAIGRWK